jgi:hypothetical protein
VQIASELIVREQGKKNLHQIGNQWATVGYIVGGFSRVSSPYAYTCSVDPGIFQIDRSESRKGFFYVLNGPEPLRLSINDSIKPSRSTRNDASPSSPTRASGRGLSKICFIPSHKEKSTDTSSPAENSLTYQPSPKTTDERNLLATSMEENTGRTSSPEFKQRWGSSKPLFSCRTIK